MPLPLRRRRGCRRRCCLPLPPLQLLAEAVQRSHLGGACLAAQQQRPAGEGRVKSMVNGHL